MEKYRIIRKLSQSQTQSNRVSLAATLTNQLVILKEVNCTGQFDKEQVLNESKVLASLSHPNIVKLLETFVINYPHSTAACVCIVTEYCEGGDLAQLVRKLNEVDVKEIIIQLLLAIKYLHDKNILHRDLKLRNIFVTSFRAEDRVLRIKVGDFGIARWLDGNQMATTMVGTPYYLSPELCAKQPYDKSVDIWSLGCVIYELLKGGKHPFNARSLEELLGRIQEEPVDYTGIPDQRLIEMLKQMLCKNPKDRLTIDGLLYLPLIQEYIQEFVTKISDSSCSRGQRQLVTPAPTMAMFSDTTELLLDTMQVFIDEKSKSLSGNSCNSHNNQNGRNNQNVHNHKHEHQQKRFNEQLNEASKCLKFILQSTPDHSERLQKEFDRVQNRQMQLLILPSRIQKFLDIIKNADYSGLKELGDEEFVEEVLGTGLIGDTLVMQKIQKFK